MNLSENVVAVLSSFVVAFFLMSCTSHTSSALKEIVIDPSQTLDFYDPADDVEPKFDIFALQRIVVSLALYVVLSIPMTYIIF